MKAVKARMIVTFLGQHNGVDAGSCFDTGLFEALKESIGLECTFQITEKDLADKHYITIQDVKFVDGTEYMDGKPVTGA